jgi:hypothetical protein
MVLFTWAHNHTLDEMYYCMGDKYDGFSEFSASDMCGLNLTNQRTKIGSFGPSGEIGEHADTVLLV